jgi:hypothetical protein
MEVGLSETILKGTHPGTIYAKLGSIWPSCFRGEDFLTLANQKKELILAAMFVLHFVPFHQQIWPPRAILVSDWLLFKKIFSSETALLNGVKLGPLSLYRSPDNRMILKQISKGDYHYLKKQQPS